MATLVLGSLGTLVGGPLGGAIGTLAGQALDSAIFGAPRREGPRLKELAVTSSSYGQPIARQYGRVRVPGTVIWATDLKEDKETSGGGKGKPKTTSYAYSISFAVALSSRPIDGVGRIWADGNLLRGVAGDLKTGGILRVHSGHADQDADPLLAAALGALCPAHRGCAYVVFEDLQLADFGNRIPALSFEVFAGSGSTLLADLVGELDEITSAVPLPELEGFSHDGGSLAQVLTLVDRLRPMVVNHEAGSTRIDLPVQNANGVPLLPGAASWGEGDFGRDDGKMRANRSQENTALAALRYYDPAREYLPGLQRVEARDGTGRGDTIEFPGVFDASAARSLLHAATARERIGQDTLAWRMAELDPSIGPGSLVRAPGVSGQWMVAGWEWREGGIELQLVRHLALATGSAASDAGNGWLPPDRVPQPSRLRFFEVPWDGNGAADTVQAFAAVGAPAGSWSGAALYAAQAGALVPLGVSASERAVSGVLAAPLGPSQALRFEPHATLMLRLDNSDSTLENATLEALATGANRLLVGGEVLQFAHAEPQSDGAWLLHGLLRGRAGTERIAGIGHPSGAQATLLDDRLIPITADQRLLASNGGLAALGLVDEAPVLATLEGLGSGRRPPSPCHPRVAFDGAGDLELRWTRRARGGWAWLADVEQPLVEQQELYEVGIGPVAAPLQRYSTTAPALVMSATLLAELASEASGAALWVRQCGSFAKSDPLFLTSLPANP
ncbi:phage tail protein [Erythrobacter sp.]|uniref:GTA baseplate fiber-binding domain-containing protein n=1 Tax=Erythrobacter sp. TaxID=1042 RepID=UPI00311FA720